MIARPFLKRGIRFVNGQRIINWFPQSGFESNNFPLTERYLNGNREDGFVEMHLLIEIK